MHMQGEQRCGAEGVAFGCVPVNSDARYAWVGGADEGVGKVEDEIVDPLAGIRPPGMRRRPRNL